MSYQFHVNTLQIESRETEMQLIIIIIICRFNASLSWHIRDQNVDTCGAHGIAECLVQDLRSFVSSS